MCDMLTGMRFRTVVLAGCFCVAMIGAASGASAQSTLPSGYTIPTAGTGLCDVDNCDSYVEIFRQSINVEECLDVTAALPNTDPPSPDDYWTGPVDAIDPLTGNVICGTDDGCYLGTITIEVRANGRNASFSGPRDCGLHPERCSTLFCSFAGKPKLPGVVVEHCSETDGDTNGICFRIPHTKANAKKRWVSTVVSWKVRFNGASIGSGRIRVETTYQPRIKPIKGHFIVTSHPDWHRQFCRYAYGGSGGPVYWRCWVYGKSGRAAEWIDFADGPV